MIPKEERLVALPSLRAPSEQDLSNLDNYILKRINAFQHVKAARDTLRDINDDASGARLDHIVHISANLFKAGIVSEKEYFFYRCLYAEQIDFDNFINGYYNEDLVHVNEQMKQIEKAYGLLENQYCLKRDAPKEWLFYSNEYEKIIDRKFEEVLAELDFVDLLELHRNDSKEYNRMREAGRRAVHAKDDVELAVIGSITDYENQAEKAAQGMAYFAAAFMMCAAAEARPLLNVLRNVEFAKDTAKPFARMAQ